MQTSHARTIRGLSIAVVILSILSILGLIFSLAFIGVSGAALGNEEVRGAASYSLSMDPDSAGSQFFIMVEQAPHLDGQYAAFGKVIEGMEVADAIVSVDRNRSDKPYEDQRMKSVTVETFGVDYPAPEMC